MFDVNPNEEKLLELSSKVEASSMPYNRKDYAVVFAHSTNDCRTSNLMVGEPALVLLLIANIAFNLYKNLPAGQRNPVDIKDRILNMEAMSSQPEEALIANQLRVVGVNTRKLYKTEPFSDNKHDDLQEYVNNVFNAAKAVDKDGTVICGAGKREHDMYIKMDGHMSYVAEFLVMELIYQFTLKFPCAKAMLPDGSEIIIRNCKDVIRYFEAYNVFMESKDIPEMPEDMFNKLLAITGRTPDSLSSDPNNPTHIHVSDDLLSEADIDLREFLQYASVDPSHLLSLEFSPD